ncbi:hypothetical protein M5D96_001758, partial [Drosophila gunungcola]
MGVDPDKSIALPKGLKKHKSSDGEVDGDAKNGRILIGRFAHAHMHKDIPNIEAKEQDIADCRPPKSPIGGVHHAVILWISLPVKVYHLRKLLKPLRLQEVLHPCGWTSYIWQKETLDNYYCNCWDPA